MGVMFKKPGERGERARVDRGTEIVENTLRQELQDSHATEHKTTGNFSQSLEKEQREELLATD